MKIYLAGPLFSTAEREFNVKVADLLRAAGHEVWLPQDSEQRDRTAEEVFRKDVEGIDWADVVVACAAQNQPRDRVSPQPAAKRAGTPEGVPAR